MPKCKCGFKGTPGEIAVHRQVLKPISLGRLMLMKEAEQKGNKTNNADVWERMYNEWKEKHFD
jgi:hypothetical protein